MHSITATRARELAVVAALFLLLALLTTWPLVTAPATHSVSDRANNDVFLNQYLIFWGAHALTEEPGNLYDTNMFYPERYGFAYADMLLTDSILLYPVIRAFYDPTLTYNVLLWLAVVIGGTGMYALCRLLVGSRVAALVAGVLFVANPTHFVRYKQPQFFNDGFLPWFLAAMLIWLASCGLWRRGVDLGAESVGRGDGPGVGGLGSTRRSLTWASGAALLFCLHSQTGSHNAIFGLLVGGGFAAYYASPLVTARWRDGSWPDGTRRFLSGAGLMALLGGLILAPLFYPYFRVGQYLESERFGEAVETANQLAAGSASTVELFTTSSHFYSWINSRFGWPSEYLGGAGPPSDLFPGVVLLFLALLSLLPARTALRPGSARRMGAGALDALLLLSALAAWATWQHGWRRLGPGFGAFPTVWVWPVMAALALAARVAWFRQEPYGLVAAFRALPRNRDLRFWLGVAVLCFVAALGPAFGLYELVRLVPAANLIRVPSRFVLPMAMALSVMAAWGVARLLVGSVGSVGSVGRHRGPIMLAVTMVFFAAEASFAPLPTVPTPYPADPAALWLGQQHGDFAVVEIPIDPSPTQATRQMLQSIHHWKKLVIGYSGAAPPGYEERMRRLATSFPDQAALDELATLDVRYLVVLEKRIFGELLDAIHAEPRLREVQRFGDTSIWELR